MSALDSITFSPSLRERAYLARLDDEERIKREKEEMKDLVIAQALEHMRRVLELTDDEYESIEVVSATLSMPAQPDYRHTAELRLDGMLFRFQMLRKKEMTKRSSEFEDEDIYVDEPLFKIMSGVTGTPITCLADLGRNIVKPS